MMKLELVREKGTIMVYELGYDFGNERKLLLEVEHSQRGRTNKIELIKTVINNI